MIRLLTYSLALKYKHTCAFVCVCVCVLLCVLTKDAFHVFPFPSLSCYYLQTPSARGVFLQLVTRQKAMILRK